MITDDEDRAQLTDDERARLRALLSQIANRLAREQGFVGPVSIRYEIKEVEAEDHVRQIQ